MKIVPKETVSFTEDSNYSRKGCIVIAEYMNTTNVRGIVIESRVRYGGAVMHTILLDHDVQLPWGPYKLKGDHCMISEDEIIGIISDKLQE